MLWKRSFLISSYSCLGFNSTLETVVEPGLESGKGQGIRVDLFYSCGSFGNFTFRWYEGSGLLFFLEKQENIK